MQFRILGPVTVIDEAGATRAVDDFSARLC